MALSKLGSGSTQKLFELSLFKICKFIKHTNHDDKGTQSATQILNEPIKQEQSQHICGRSGFPKMATPTQPIPHVILTMNETQTLLYEAVGPVSPLPQALNQGTTARPQPTEHGRSDPARLQRQHHEPRWHVPGVHSPPALHTWLWSHLMEVKPPCWRDHKESSHKEMEQPRSQTCEWAKESEDSSPSPQGTPADAG